jgi:hypothetical protein
LRLLRPGGLAQEQEVGAELVLREGERVALEVLAALADAADVFVLGGLPVIFELDKRGELCR